MQTISISPDFTVSYRRAGQGSPLVFLHAFPLSSAMWENQIEQFSPELVVLAPDIRGIGKTTLFQDVPSMQTAAHDVAAWLNAIGEERPIVLVGLSMGGYTALEFVRAYPQKLRGLVLCDTRADPDNAESKKARNEMIEFAKGASGKAVTEKMLPKLLGQSTLQSDSDVPTFVKSIGADNSGKSLAALASALRDRRDSTDLLHRIEAPTLVIGGDEDAVTSPQIMAPLATEIPNARYVIIEKAGHLSNLEQPYQFNAALHQFLNEL